MKKLIVALGILTLIWACSNSEENSQESSEATESVAAQTSEKPDGEKLYRNQCVTCHGLYGDMGASGAFNLTTSELTVEERINVITNGRNAMPGFKALMNEEKIKAVAEYTLELKK
jgi:mono/diheme cytochrome c family protein